MKAFVFPGQGAQFTGMGKDLYDNNPIAKELFDKADEILGFSITNILFNGTDEELEETKVTARSFSTQRSQRSLSGRRLLPRHGSRPLIGRIFSPCSRWRSEL